MSRYETEVVAAIESGSRFVSAQDDDVSAYKRLLHRLTVEQSDRPLVLWDENLGLRSNTITDPLPENADLGAALQFVLSYKGRAVFLLDCTTSPLSEADGMTRRFAMLEDKLSTYDGVLVVLLVRGPLPASLAKYPKCIGETAAPSQSAAVTTSPSKTSGASNRYSDFRNRDAFDTPAWQERLRVMPAEELREIVAAGEYKDSLDRICELRQVLKKRFAHKDSVLNALFIASVAQVPCVLMGPPGAAKGHMIRSFCEGLGLSGQTENAAKATRQYFEYQLTRFTTPEEIFGPIHVKKLIDEQSYRRVTEGYLPTAQVTFLDEIFKASSAILNTLLSVLNERVFYNEGHPEPIPLTQIFAASNEPPQDESLNALYDRFPLRINCPAVDDDHLSDLLDRAWEDGFDRAIGRGASAVPVVACSNDLRLLNRVSRLMFGGRATEPVGSHGTQGFKAEFLRCFRALRHQYGISDRSISALYAYSRASALMSGRREMDAEDLDVFRMVHWDATGELDRFVGNLKKVYRA